MWLRGLLFYYIIIKYRSAKKLKKYFYAKMCEIWISDWQCINAHGVIFFNVLILCIYNLKWNVYINNWYIVKMIAQEMWIMEMYILFFIQNNTWIWQNVFHSTKIVKTVCCQDIMEKLLHLAVTMETNQDKNELLLWAVFFLIYILYTTRIFFKTS